MFALKLTFLTGRFAASSSGQATWPPEPDRLFNALTAAWGRQGEDPHKRRLLEWLETLGPPHIHASSARLGAARKAYVPQNDFGTGGKVELIPDLRAKVERNYVSVIPETPEVVFVWPEAEPHKDEKLLQQLCADVSYVGQSTSSVQLEIFNGDCSPNYRPVSKRTDIQLRVPASGRLHALCEFFAKGMRPKPVAVQLVYYEHLGTEVSDDVHTQTIFGRWEILRCLSDVPYEANLSDGVVSAVRRVLVGRAADLQGHHGPVNPIISGHEPDGSPALNPHVAIVPLIDVGWPQSTGMIRGFALIKPTTFSPEDEATFDNILMMPKVDTDGVITESPIAEIDWPGGRKCQVSIETVQPSLATLKPDRYFGPSKSWATVLPYRFEGMRKKPFGTPAGDRETLQMVAKSCARIGLPAPQSVVTVFKSPMTGASDVRDFPADTYGRRYPLRHLIIKFDEPIRGPVLIGADRYRGFGLCLPLDR